MNTRANIPFLLFFLFSVTAILPVSGFAQEQNPEAHFSIPCVFYKTGKFAYTTPDLIGITFYRRGNKQIEINETSGERTVFKVKWEDDCHYNLTFIKSNQPSRLRKGWEIKYEIEETYDDFYYYKADRYAIFSYGTVKKMLTRKEQKQLIKREQQRIADEEAAKLAAEEAAAKEASGELDEEGEEAEGDEDDGKGKKKDKKKKEKEKGEKGKNKDSKKKDKSGKKDKSEKKEKSGKKEKSKKEKKKKEKKPKQKKEKKEKEPKPKKEKKEKDDE